MGNNGVKRFFPSRPTSEFLNYQKYGAAIPIPVGNQGNPASSILEVREYYQNEVGIDPENGSYWFSMNGSLFETYCLFNEFDGNDWMLMFMINADDQSIDYDSSYWSTRNALNVSESTLDYTVNRNINVATGLVNNYAFRYMALSSYGQNLNLNTYAIGSSTNSLNNFLTSYTNIGISMGSKVGSGSLTLPWGSGSGGTPGSQFRYNQSSTTARSGNAYSRWGQAQYAEPYGGSYYTFRYYGLGARGDHVCSSAYSGDVDFGIGSGRHSAGGCGDAPSGGATFSKHEMWVRQ